MPNIDHGPVSLDDLEGRNFAEVWEAAAILECDRRTVRSAVERGEIPGTRFGLKWHIPVAWLRQAALADQSAGGAS